VLEGGVFGGNVLEEEAHRARYLGALDLDTGRFE
jgi:hypothetical protein